MNGCVNKAIRLARILVCVAVIPGYCHAQVTTTNIVDTVYRADGTPAGGSLLISWPAFTTSDGQSVSAGKTQIEIAADGIVNFSLAANANAIPSGTFYTAVYHLSDGTVSTEYWIVPRSKQVRISEIRSDIIHGNAPLDSADSSITERVVLPETTAYLPLSGGTLTGPLYLSEDPVQPTEAVTKHYVDTDAGALIAGLASKVSLNPTAAQTITQPVGTTLEVNDLQSVLYASANQTGTGNNGIANSMAEPNCQSGGCFTIADPGYSTVEEPQGGYYAACFGGEPGMGDGDFCGYQWPINSRLWDQRSGTDFFEYQDTVNRFGGLGVSQPLNYPAGFSSDAATAMTRIANYDTDYGNGQVVAYKDLQHQFAGGHNGNYGSGWAKTNVELGQDKAVDFSEGQHQIHPQVEYCLGLGDCLGSPVEISFAVGLSAPSDEGIHGGDKWINEDSHVFQGSCTSGCASGSTLLTTKPTSGQGDQGEGRMAIDITQASAGNLGSITLGVGTGQITGEIYSSGNTPTQFVAPAGTFNPSTGIATITAAIVAPAGQGTPGLQTVSIATNSGRLVPGIACITDLQAFEMVNLTAASTTSLTASFRKPHLAATLVLQGGTCGYGIAINADTTQVTGNTVRVLLPMLGSPDSAHTYINTFIGGAYFGEGSAWNYQTAGGGATYNSATGLVTVTGNFGFSENDGPQGPGLFGNIYGQDLTITGATDPNYNGTYPVTIVGTSAFTYTPSTAPSISSTSLTVTECNCTFTMYPRAEVLSVYNTATKQVDGTLGLEPNSVAWASGDTIEVPHWHQPDINDTHDAISMYTPQAEVYGRGYNYNGMVSGDLHGFDLRNNGAVGQYLGFGGWHTPPNTAQYVDGWWNRDITYNFAPNEAILSVGCKPSTPGNGDGCTKFDAAYSIGEFKTAANTMARFNFDPNANNFTFANGYPCSTVIGTSVGTTNGTTVGGLAVVGAAATCDLLARGLVLNGGTALIGQTGTGTSVVTNTAPAIASPTLSSAVLNGGTVPAGQTLTIAGTLNITGTCTGCNGGGTPTVASGPGAGTGAAVSLSNATDAKGIVSVTAGTSPAASGTIATITFVPAYSSAPVCTVTPSSASAIATFYSAPASASAFTLNASGTALTAGATYTYSYTCLH